MKDDKELDFSEHLKAFSRMLLKIVLSWAVVFVLLYYNSSTILEWLVDYAKQEGWELVYLTPQECLFVQIRIAVYCSIFTALPIAACFIYNFVCVALSVKERICFVATVLFGLLGFCGGVILAFKCMLPVILTFLQGINNSVSITASVSLKEFVSLIVAIVVLFGIVAEMPLASIVLTYVGVLDSDKLKRAEKFSIILIFVVAALVTPPDVISQLLVAIPIILLYKISILLSKIIKRRRKHSNESIEQAKQGFYSN